MNSDGAELVDREGWRLWIAPGLVSEQPQFRDELFARISAAAAGILGPPLRRSRHAATFRVSIGAGAAPETHVFLKLLDPPRALQWIKSSLRGGRAAHVARVTAQLNAAGFAAPPVLIHGREHYVRREHYVGRARGGGREIIVTAQAQGDGPFRALAASADAPAHKRAVLYALGAEIGRLHRAGFIHGDLTPYNLFVVPGEPPRFVFVDHERTRRTIFKPSTWRQLRNLVQLGHFALPGISRTDRMRVARGYAIALGRREWRPLVRRASAMLTRRLRRDGPTSPEHLNRTDALTMKEECDG